MVPTGLDQLWVADITYVHLREEFAFLAIVLDAFSRRVIGWALEDHLQASLAIGALSMALKARRPAPGSLIHHSDRGVQYACGDYADLLATHDIQPSMSRDIQPSLHSALSYRPPAEFEAHLSSCDAIQTGLGPSSPETATRLRAEHRTARADHQ